MMMTGPTPSFRTVGELPGRERLAFLGVVDLTGSPRPGSEEPVGHGQKAATVVPLRTRHEHGQNTDNQGQAGAASITDAAATA